MTVVWLRFAIGVAILGAAVRLRNPVSLPAGRDLGYFACSRKSHEDGVAAQQKLAEGKQFGKIVLVP